MSAALQYRKRALRFVRGMLTIHKIALVLALAASVLAVIAALTQVWELALICVVALLLGNIALVIYSTERQRPRHRAR